MYREGTKARRRSRRNVETRPDPFFARVATAWDGGAYDPVVAIKEALMAVTVVWDHWFKDGAESEGLRLTRQVWRDMRSFDGYVSHQILVDQDNSAHVVALGRWKSREHAEQVKEKYKRSPVIGQLTPLLVRPRERWVMHEDESASAA
jgi:quinol monooxygenase YgiN